MFSGSFKLIRILILWEWFVGKRRCSMYHCVGISFEITVNSYHTVACDKDEIRQKKHCLNPSSDDVKRTKPVATRSLIAPFVLGRQ